MGMFAESEEGGEILLRWVGEGEEGEEGRRRVKKEDDVKV